MKNIKKNDKDLIFFKLLRSLCEELWKMRNKREKISEEALLEFIECFEKVIYAMPLLDRKYISNAGLLVFEACSEISLLFLDKAYLPLLTRVIVALFKNLNYEAYTNCILRLLTYLEFDNSKIKAPLNRKVEKEILKMVKLPKDEKKRSAAKDGCKLLISRVIRTMTPKSDTITSSELCKFQIAKIDAEYHVKSPKSLHIDNFIGQ